MFSPEQQAVADAFNSLPTSSQNSQAVAESVAAISSLNSPSTPNTDIGQKSYYMQLHDWLRQPDFIDKWIESKTTMFGIAGAPTKDNASPDSLFGLKVSVTSVLATIVGFILLLGAFMIYRK